jgi:hypothetical protein
MRVGRKVLLVQPVATDWSGQGLALVVGVDVEKGAQAILERERAPQSKKGVPTPLAP